MAQWGAERRGALSGSVEALGGRGAETPAEPRAQAGSSVRQMGVARPQGRGQGPGDGAMLDLSQARLSCPKVLQPNRGCQRYPLLRPPLKRSCFPPACASRGLAQQVQAYGMHS